MKEENRQNLISLCVDALASVVVGASVVVAVLLVSLAAFGLPDWYGATTLGTALGTYFFLVGK